MKNIITICAALLMTASLFAQAHEKMSYQAVVRAGSNNLVISSTVGMRIYLLQDSASGTAVYVETQTPTSKANGLVNLASGNGTVVSGTFATIDWANGPYFIKTETDPTGGINYTITGTSQLLSVPYAFYANTAGNVSTYSVGDFAQGGIVFWVDETGQHGLVCALEDQDGGSGLTWRAGSTDYRTLSVGGNSLIYGGATNTSQMLAVSVSKGDAGNLPTDCAASACVYYTGGGFGDWYLPNAHELNTIYLNRANVESAIIANGGTAFANAPYWSSTEGTIVSAAYVGFDNISNGTTLKSNLYRVRAIRRF